MIKEKTLLTLTYVISCLVVVSLTIIVVLAERGPIWVLFILLPTGLVGALIGTLIVRWIYRAYVGNTPDQIKEKYRFQLEVKYEINSTDLGTLRTQLSQAATTRSTLSLGKSVTIIIAVLLILTSLVLWRIHSRVYTIIPLILCAVIILYYFLSKMAFTKAYKFALWKDISNLQNQLLGMHHVEFKSDSFTDITENETFSIALNNIDRVVKTDQYVVIISRSLQGIVIPKRVFPDDSSFANFNTRS